MNIIEKLKQRAAPVDPVQMECLFSATEKEVIDYTEKESRAEKINYSGIGQTTYGSGQPPQIYQRPLTAFKKYPIVYGCITAISEAISVLDCKVFSVDGGEREEISDHPFYALYKKPNPYQGSFEFLEEMQQCLDTYGNAFIAKEKVGGTIELYNLMTPNVAIIPDPKKKIKEYRYVINGVAVKYKPEEVIHIKYTDLDDPYYGLPPLASAETVLAFESNRLTFASQFFNNGAIPAGVLETEQNLGETLLKKLRGEWHALHRGVSNSHKIAILQGGLKYRPISSPLKDLDFSGLKELTRDDILTIYKVPESILGSQEGTGSSEGKAALTTFWRSSVVPRLKRIESAINRGLGPDLFGDGATLFEFNLKNVIALQEDKQQQGDYLERMVGASVMTIDEARAVIGLPKLNLPYTTVPLVSNSFFGNQMMPLATALDGEGGAGSTEEKPAAKPKPAAAE